MSLAAQGFLPAFLQKALVNGDACLAIIAGRTYTFADVERASGEFAIRMRAMGLQQGARVAVMLRNSPELITCIFGASRAGLVWVPINPELRSESLKYVIEHSQPDILIIRSESLAKIDQSGVDLTDVKVVVIDEHPA